MKRITTALLLLSFIGLITALVLLYTESFHFIFSVHLLVTTLVSIAVFFSVKIIQKHSVNIGNICLIVGFFLVKAFAFQLFFYSEMLGTTWPFILIGIIALLLLGVNQLLLQTKSILSTISRISFLVAGILFLLINLLKLSNQTYFSSLFFSLIIGSLTLLIVTIQTSLKKEA